MLDTGWLTKRSWMPLGKVLPGAFSGAAKAAPSLLGGAAKAVPGMAAKAAPMAARAVPNAVPKLQPTMQQAMQRAVRQQAATAPAAGPQRGFLRRMLPWGAGAGAVGAGGAAGLGELKHQFGYYDQNDPNANYAFHRARMAGNETGGAVGGLMHAIANPGLTFASMMHGSDYSKGPEFLAQASNGGRPIVGPDGRPRIVSDATITVRPDLQQAADLVNRTRHDASNPRFSGAKGPYAGTRAYGIEDMLGMPLQQQQQRAPAGYDPRFPPGAYGYIPGVSGPLRDI